MILPAMDLFLAYLHNLDLIKVWFSSHQGGYLNKHLHFFGGMAEVRAMFNYFTKKFNF